MFLIQIIEIIIHFGKKHIEPSSAPTCEFPPNKNSLHLCHVQWKNCKQFLHEMRMQYCRSVSENVRKNG